MLNKTWLATDGESIWPMENEGDYNEGDTVICVAVMSDGNLQIEAGKQDTEFNNVILVPSA